MKARRLDFVNVRLTAAGEKQVGPGGTLTVSNRHMHYTFRPGEMREVVLRYEWSSVLRNERVNGSIEPLFEVVDEAAVGEEASTEPDVEIVEEGDINGSV